MNWRTFLPLGAFVALAAALGVGLTLDPRSIPSALVGKPVPEFALPPLPGRSDGFASADLKGGQPSLVNVFASWCVPCRVEHPLLVDLAKQGVPIFGLNYKDQQGAQFLAELGDPYLKTGFDERGRVGIDWGVYGVPETFVVTGDGRIACKHIGPLMPHDVTGKILPALADLRTKGTTDKCSAG